MRGNTHFFNLILIIIAVYIAIIFLISVTISYRQSKSGNIDMAELCAYARKFMTDTDLSEIGKELDCSGYTQIVYNKFGRRIPASASQQYRRYHFDNNEMKQGDLIFFSTNKKNISHVGIYLGDSAFIHSPGKNREIKVDDLKSKYWKQCFRGTGSVVKK